MAKMFYTLEETAQKLGVSEDEVKAMASDGSIQQFRDRDRLMFKRDQVDGLATKKGDSGDLIPLADSGDTSQQSSQDTAGTPSESSGVDVFDSGEVKAADPAAQTEVSEPTVADEEDLSLDSVGSGSGLLDLTRESDDTSLGAELLDEIYPTDEGTDEKAASAGESGTLFQEEAEPAGTVTETERIAPDALASVAVVDADDIYDAAGNGMSTGLLIGATAGLVVTLIVAISALGGVSLTLTKVLAASTAALSMYAGGLLVVSLILGLVGYLIGRSRG